MTAFSCKYYRRTCSRYTIVQSIPCPRITVECVCCVRCKPYDCSAYCGLIVIVCQAVNNNSGTVVAVYSADTVFKRRICHAYRYVIIGVESRTKRPPKARGCCCYACYRYAACHTFTYPKTTTEVPPVPQLSVAHSCVAIAFPSKYISPPDVTILTDPLSTYELTGYTSKVIPFTRCNLLLLLAAMPRLLRSKSRPLRALGWCWVLPIVPVLWNM
mgnify:CR=1 FL=1